MRTVTIIRDVPDLFQATLIEELKKMGFKFASAIIEGHNCYSIGTDMGILHCSSLEGWKSCFFVVENVFDSTLNGVADFLGKARQYKEEFERPKLKIGDYEVSSFTEKGFNVGCQFVSWSDFDKIVEERKQKGF